MHTQRHMRDTFSVLLRRRFIVAILYWLIAAFIFLMWIWGADSTSTSFNGDPRSTFSGLIQGTAYRPFVQRLLIPTLTNVTYNLVPLPVWSKLSLGLLDNPKFLKESTRLGWENNFLPQYVIALTWAFLSLVAFAFVFRSFVNELYTVEDTIRNGFPIAALLCLPIFFRNGTHYIYDFPALLFFTIGLLFLIKNRWLLFYIVFLIGCLNKETMVFLLFIPAIVQWRTMNRRILSIHLLMLLFIFILIHELIAVRFASNPGSSLEFHLFGNIHKLLMPYSLLDICEAGILFTLLFYDFSSKPQFLRYSLWVLFPFVVVVFIFACIEEARDLYEIFPICFILMAHTILFSWLKIPYRLKL